MSLEAFAGETSKSAFPQIPWTAEGAEARRGRLPPDCNITSGRMEGGVLELHLKKEA